MSSTNEQRDTFTLFKRSEVQDNDSGLGEVSVRSTSGCTQPGILNLSFSLVTFGLTSITTNEAVLTISGNKDCVLIVQKTVVSTSLLSNYIVQR